MTGTADPWEPPSIGALQRHTEHRPSLERTGGPERIYDAAAADPEWTPRPVGFTAHLEQP